MTKARRDLLSAILVLVGGVVVAVLLTIAQVRPTMHSIGTVVIAAVAWGAFMGWNLRGPSEGLNVIRSGALQARSMSDAEMDGINAVIRREWNRSEEDKAWKEL